MTPHEGGLDAQRWAALERLAGLLAASPHSLVSRRERGTILDVHVPECLGVAALLRPAGGSSWMDLGTGGGLPGLVLAIACPDVTWTLVDATAKKAEAVRDFADELGLGNVNTLAARAEHLARDPGHRGRYDGVVSRALARLVVACELSRGFLRSGGVLAAVKGTRWGRELDEATPALGRLRVRDAAGTAVPGAVRPSVLVTMRADGPPPTAVPRRDGIPARAPLGKVTPGGRAQG